MIANPATLEELAALPGYSVGTRIAAKFLGTSQWGLTLAAKAGALGLKHTFSGNRLYISKADLLEYCGYKGNKPVNDEKKLFTGSGFVPAKR